MRSAVIAASSASPAAAPRLAGALLRTQPDIRLAQLAGEGSEAAFEEIVRRYRSGLVAFAGKIASRDSADDVVQDSMVKAHSALLRGDRPDSPRAWLFRIVRNTALNERRDNRVHDRLDEHYDGVEQPPEAADRRRQLNDLLMALRELPRAQREAIVQRELEGRGHDEIAAALHVSPGAVRQLIFRARSALRAGIGALLPVQVLRCSPGQRSRQARERPRAPGSRRS
jgi:RNA polymerase sigma factor (sigma-70 family)